jgi:hypothetical protein
VKAGALRQEIRKPSDSLLRAGTSPSESLRMNRFRNVSVCISKRGVFTPLKPHGSEIRDRGVFSCAPHGETTAKSSARSTGSATRCVPGRLTHPHCRPQTETPWNARHVPIDRALTRSFLSPAVTICSGDQPVRLAQVVSGFRRRVRKIHPAGLSERRTSRVIAA